MSSPDRLGELRTRALPHLIRALKGEQSEPHVEGSAVLSKRAVQRFDNLYSIAHIFHRDHPADDPDIHLGRLMQPFIEAGMPALAALPIAEFVISNERPAE